MSKRAALNDDTKNANVEADVGILSITSTSNSTSNSKRKKTDDITTTTTNNNTQEESDANASSSSGDDTNDTTTPFTMSGLPIPVVARIVTYVADSPVDVAQLRLVCRSFGRALKHQLVGLPCNDVVVDAAAAAAVTNNEENEEDEYQEEHYSCYSDYAYSFVYGGYNDNGPRFNPKDVCPRSSGILSPNRQSGEGHFVNAVAQMCKITFGELGIECSADVLDGSGVSGFPEFCKCTEIVVFTSDNKHESVPTQKGPSLPNLALVLDELSSPPSNSGHFHN